MLTHTRPPARSSGQVRLVRATQKDTSGGSRDTDTKELTVSPAGRPSESRPVTATTPLASRLSTARNSSGPGGGPASAAPFVCVRTPSGIGLQHPSYRLHHRL